jgi:hypothetical protein
MSQRVTLAQTQLQLAQTNPEMHNLYEAYKRMYQALGVTDIQAILPVPQTPSPKDPAIENANALAMMTLTAFRGQDHQAHISAHRTTMSSLLVKSNPQVMTVFQTHILEHISMLAREEIEAANAEAIQQEAAKYGGELPPELQQQFQQVIETQVAAKIDEYLEEMFLDELQETQSQGQDPLVALKEQEIQLKARDIQRKEQNDQGRLSIDQQKLQQTAEIAEDRIQSQEDIAQLRANVNLTKAKEPKKIDEQRNIRFEN